ncbi:hypothetical protein MRX96_001496 [Rhipicephalus microplus]
MTLVPGFALSTYGVEYEGPDSIEVTRGPSSWSKQLTLLSIACHQTSTGAYRQTPRSIVVAMSMAEFISFGEPLWWQGAELKNLVDEQSKKAEEQAYNVDEERVIEREATKQQLELEQRALELRLKIIEAGASTDSTTRVRKETEKTKRKTGGDSSSEPRRNQSDTTLVPGFSLSTYGVEYEGPDSVEATRGQNSWSKQLTVLLNAGHRTNMGANRQAPRSVRGHEGRRPAAPKRCSLLQPLHQFASSPVPQASSPSTQPHANVFASTATLPSHHRHRQNW